MKKTKLRFKCVVFIHAICTGIYAGIQGSHAAQELVLRLSKSNLDFSVRDALNVRQWLEEDKTYVFLNGGMTPSMRKIKRTVKQIGFPWAEFREPDVGNMMTAIAVLVPEDWMPETIVARKFNRLLFNSKLAK
jgi:hypothetical protein